MGTGDTLLGGGGGGGRGGYPAMDWHPVQGRVAILLGILHAKETVWAVCLVYLYIFINTPQWFISNRP